MPASSTPASASRHVSRNPVRIHSLCAALLLFPFVAAAQHPRVITAYVFPQEQLLAANTVDARKLTRINYAFANIHSGLLSEGFPATETQNLATLVALKKTNPALTVLVSVGGWSWSGGFSDMALTPASRARFIDSVITYLHLHQLDGLDIDWEYPGQSGAAHKFRPQDKQNYTRLLQELRTRFDHEEKMQHHHLLLTIAAGSNQAWLQHTEMGKIQQSVDTVNLMAYDYYEPSNDAITGNHAPLFPDPADPKAVSADASVKAFEQAGVPAAKLVLGVPFYGHVWGNVAAGATHGLFQPGKPVPNAYATYPAIQTTMLPHGYQRYWDAASAVPYLYNAATHTFVSYEDPESLERKAAYIRQYKLAGVMFWEYSNDPTGTLLNILAKALQAPGQGGSAK